MYPEWSYFPRNVRAPDWVSDVVSVVVAAESDIGTLTTKGPRSECGAGFPCSRARGARVCRRVGEGER